MKDLFSQHADSYAAYRPSYPDSLIVYLASLCSEHELAWDCATGNGQAAIALTRFFERVIATDLSQEQLDQAPAHPQIEYRRATAETSTLEANSVSLITVAQALHWFKRDAFYSEVKRVLRPSGILAVWSYALCSVDPGVDRILLDFYHGPSASYWEPERALVDEGYASLTLPFSELKVPTFHMEQEWDLSQYLGYLRTWSAVRKAMKVQGTDPLGPHLAAWEKAWGDPASRRKVHFPLAVRVVRRD